jgi:hypothetical protein
MNFQSPGESPAYAKLIVIELSKAIPSRKHQKFILLHRIINTRCEEVRLLLETFRSEGMGAGKGGAS